MTPCSPNPQSLTGSEYKKSKVGFPIRKSSDQSLFAAPQGLSQRTTSFIASQRQGIHRMLLFHLITLMIDVRLLLTEKPDQKTIAASARRPANDRNDDLKLAKLPLSQLSYGPSGVGLKRRREHPFPWLLRA